MRPAAIAALAVLVAALAAGGGYWAGHRSAGQGGGAAGQPAGTPAKAERRILFYRNPMGLPDTSPAPKKDPMGMDYIAVYEGEEEAGSAGQIKISTEKVQKLGVRTEAASRRAMDQVVRAAGRIEPDERRLYTIAPKFEGYVERLFVNATGQAVGKGQVLFEVYSPELVSAQREYAIAAQGAEALGQAGGEAQESMRQLAQASLSRLRNWDIAEGEVQALARSGQIRRTLGVRSPVAGIVTEKKAVQGMRFMPGEVLYQVADLSTVWVIAEVFEQDAGLLGHLVQSRAQARVSLAAYPGRVFEGVVSYVYPTMNAETRTVPVRIELANPGLLLKPGMFAQVELPAAGREAVVTVPRSAVIDSGARQIVLVQAGEGRFEPREVKLGRRGDGYAEVLEGVKEGEPVVVAANFLIDAESNLKAALGGFGPATPGGAPDTGAAKAGHQAKGKVQAVDPQAGTVDISHGPVPSLGWPAMTMAFKVANASLLQGLNAGAEVSFEFVERGPGEWVITAVQSNAAGTEHKH